MDPYQSKTYPRESVNLVIAMTGSGPITLTTSDKDSVSVDVTPASPGDNCVVVQKLKGTTLELAIHGATIKGILSRFGGGPFEPCSAGFAVSAPPHIAIKASSGSGSIALGAFSGKADVKTGSGDISLNGPSGALSMRSGSGRMSGAAPASKVDVNTGSGDVTLSGLTDDVTARSGSGAVELSWAEAPRSGAIDVRTGSGSFRATLPAATRLKASLSSASGRVHNDFADDKTSALRLTFRSGSGSATVTKAP